MTSETPSRLLPVPSVKPLEADEPVPGREALIPSLDPFGPGNFFFSVRGTKPRWSTYKQERHMGIFSRARDIIQANVNDILDRAEDPSKTIRLAIMEMEETLAEVRASAARIIADQKELKRLVIRMEQARQNWETKAEFALSKDREDLATAALTEKQKLGQDIALHQQDIEELNEQLGLHQDDIIKLEAKLREARTRQNSLLSRLETAQNRARVQAMTRGARVQEAFSRFELMERRVDLAEGRAEAYDLAPEPRSLDDEIADMRTSDEVTAELAEMKARMQARH